MHRLIPFLGILLSVCSPARANQVEFRHELERLALGYFLDQTNPKTGLVLDRAANLPGGSKNHLASIAATGFGMAVLSHAAQYGQIPRAEAIRRIEAGTRFALDHLAHHKGWLYHFSDWDTGARMGLSEVSTIDTALFLAGALYAAQVFPDEPLARMARALYERVDFGDMMTNGGAFPSKRTLSMGWLPESGYLPWDWDRYSELMILVLLGLGHPTHPLPATAWSAWQRPLLRLPWGAWMIGDYLPLFAHQYSQLFVDLRHSPDAYANYFLSSVAATERDRAVCAADRTSETFREGFWGLSASDSPSGYYPFSPITRNGTVCPACAGASAMFLPDEVMTDLEHWAHGKWRSSLWGRYGFSDSLNLDARWFDKDVLGITVGALYLSLSNLDVDSSVWRDFDRIPAITTALERAGLQNGG